MWIERNLKSICLSDVYVREQNYFGSMCVNFPKSNRSNGMLRHRWKLMFLYASQSSVCMISGFNRNFPYSSRLINKQLYNLTAFFKRRSKWVKGCENYLVVFIYISEQEGTEKPFSSICSVFYKFSHSYKLPPTRDEHKILRAIKQH